MTLDKGIYIHTKQQIKTLSVLTDLVENIKETIISEDIILGTNIYSNLILSKEHNLIEYFNESKNKNILKTYEFSGIIEKYLLDYDFLKSLRDNLLKK